jgi:hypothetical protein
MSYRVLQLILYLQEERSIIISELKTLTAENKEYNVVVETLQNYLGMFRDGNNTMQAQSTVLRSVVEELNPWSTHLSLLYYKWVFSPLLFNRSKC